MADIALVPEGHIFECSDSVSTQNPGQARQTLARDRVPFMRHGTRALLAFGKEFLRFQHFRSLQMAEFSGPAFDACADQGQCADEFSVQIPLDLER